jgi:hypothetical protein
MTQFAHQTPQFAAIHQAHPAYDRAKGLYSSNASLSQSHVGYPSLVVPLALGYPQHSRTTASLQ